jgi:hypothetical protein
VQIFKRRTIDCFLQKLRADINSSALLNHLYIHLTDSFEPALYLDKLFNKTYRRAFSRLRLSSHGLRIETGRYGSDRLPREERTCLLCNSRDIEDEFHFIIICNCYTELRRRFLKRYYYNRPSMFKFIQLIKTSNKSELLGLSKYIYLASKHRTDLLNMNQ